MENTLLICTVGGTEEPLVASILHWKPSRIIFIPTQRTRQNIELILSGIEEKNFCLEKGQYREILLFNEDDFTAIVKQIREVVEGEIFDWTGRGSEYKVVADFTGGTKCMTAALTAVCLSHPVEFSYVGGKERTKDGTGIVITGTEQVLISRNPWDSLGYKIVNEASLLFDRGNYSAARDVVEDNSDKITDRGLKESIKYFGRFLNAYLLWDQFKHNDAEDELKVSMCNMAHLRHLFPNAANELEQVIKSNCDFLSGLKTDRLKLVYDLIGNAKRKATAGYYDDAVARLYRAVEALGQITLEEEYNIKSNQAPLNELPEEVKLSRNSVDGDKVKLGLQDVYATLKYKGNALADQFYKLELNDKDRSPLTMRNNSILAHGFSPVTKRAYKGLFDIALKLAEIKDENLPIFPKLSPH